MMLHRIIAIGGFLLAVQCTVSDDERCPEGFTYRSDTMSCHKNEVDSDTLDENDASPDGSPDSGKAHGIGTACRKGTDDCEGFEGNYCVDNPVGEGGFCTISNCVPADCPVGFTCCDCTQSTKVETIKACIPNDYVSALIGYANCTCSNG